MTVISPHRTEECLTVLDFIGNAHRKFRFDRRFRALIGGSRAGLRKAIEHGFPHLPAGCEISLVQRQLLFPVNDN